MCDNIMRDEEALRREVNALVNKITLQNAGALLQQLQEYYVLHDKTNRASRYFPSGATEAFRMSISQHLFEGLGEGEVLISPMLVPLAIIVKAIQICEGSHSPAMIIKSLTESFVERINEENPPLKALQNITIYFCLLFELDVFDFQFVSTLALYLAHVLREDAGDRRNAACELLLTILRLSNDKISHSDPSWIPSIIDLATDASITSDPKSSSARISILVDFLRELKYGKYRPGHHRKRGERTSKKLDTLVIGDQIEAARSIVLDFAKALLKHDVKRTFLREGNLSITWEQCRGARNARWWCKSSSVEARTTHVPSIIETPLFQDAVHTIKFPFDSHPHRRDAHQSDNRIDTPVRIRFWNSLIESRVLKGKRQQALHLTKEFSFQLLQTAFAKFKVGEISMKKTLDKYAADLVVVLDVLAEKMSLYLTREYGEYLFQCMPFMTVLIQYICQESREFRFLLHSRLVSWMHWISIKSRSDSESLSSEQLLLLLVESQYAATYIFHQRSLTSFLSRNSNLTKSQMEGEIVKSKGHLFMRLKLPEPPVNARTELTKAEIYYILLLSSLFALTRTENEFCQVFYPLKMLSKKRKDETIGFAKHYFVLNRLFLTLLPLIEMQWRSTRQKILDRSNLEEYLIDHASKLCSWLDEQ